MLLPSTFWRVRAPDGRCRTPPAPRRGDPRPAQAAGADAGSAGRAGPALASVPQPARTRALPAEHAVAAPDRPGPGHHAADVDVADARPRRGPGRVGPGRRAASGRKPRRVGPVVG